MREKSVPKHSLGEVPALVDTSAPQTAVQSVAEPADIPWDARALPMPKMPGSLPTPSITAKRAAPEEPARPWNTHKLGLRVGVDALAAGAAGVLVAPVITMIDKGIIENASGRNTLGESLKNSARELMLKPHRFLGSKPFALIFVRLANSFTYQQTIHTVHALYNSSLKKPPFCESQTC
jgi:hypothetical protein